METLAREALAHYFAQHDSVVRYCVAFSGGMDSHVLLYLAHELLADAGDVELRAIHVDHALTDTRGEWAQHARAVAEQLGVPLVVSAVQVDTERGEGPEAAARTARYAALASEISPGEHLLLAQHASDQAETFLLQALRGSGPDGLAGIPRKRHFGAGIIARPLLGCPREALASVAEQAALEWIEDPSNADTRFDRNFLRHEILPRLEARWPAAVRTLGRSAHRASASSRLLLALAREDIVRVRFPSSGELSIPELRRLPRERAYNVLRLWVRQAGFRMPRLQDLMQVHDNLVGASDSSAGRVNVRDYEFRRYRDQLHLLAPQVDGVRYEYEWAPPFDDLEVPEANAVLTREGCRRQAIALPLHGSITVRSRSGGETIRFGEPPQRKELRKVFQEAGIPPWERGTVPLLLVDERLIAVWNVAVAVDARPLPDGSPPADPPADPHADPHAGSQAGSRVGSNAGAEVDTDSLDENLDVRSHSTRAVTPVD